MLRKNDQTQTAVALETEEEEEALAKGSSSSKAAVIPDVGCGVHRIRYTHSRNSLLGLLISPPPLQPNIFRAHAHLCRWMLRDYMGNRCKCTARCHWRPTRRRPRCVSITAASMISGCWDKLHDQSTARGWILEMRLSRIRRMYVTVASLSLYVWLLLLEVIEPLCKACTVQHDLLLFQWKIVNNLFVLVTLCDLGIV